MDGLRYMGRWCLCLAMFALIAHSARASDGRRTALPEDVGIDSAPLVEMFDFIRDRKVPVHSVQIVRHGVLALDAYFYPFEPGTRHDVASVTKSITSLLIGLALDEKRLPGVRQPLTQAFPELRVAHVDERKSRITLEHLLCMTAGWDCGFEPKEARLFEMRRSSDWLQFMLDLPMTAEPGTRWAYCSGNSHVLSILLTRTTGSNAFSFAQRELFGPLGIKDVGWPVDPAGHNHGWGDLQLRPRDMARIGELMLQRGRWRDRQVLSEAWVTASTRPHVERTSNNDHYGYAWWVKGTNFPGMFEAVGRGGQRITVWPARDVVVVFTGGGFEPGDLAPFLLKAIKPDGPLPANRDASRQLRNRLTAAQKPTTLKRRAKLPDVASSISGKEFELSPNPLHLKLVRLDFKSPSEAHAQFVWQDQRVTFPVGMDNVPRLSTNSITKLRQTATGEWLNANTFVLHLDLVGGINRYRFQFTFPDHNSVDIHVTERTGLGDERFRGVATKARNY